MRPEELKHGELREEDDEEEEKKEDQSLRESHSYRHMLTKSLKKKRFHSYYNPQPTDLLTGLLLAQGHFSLHIAFGLLLISGFV